MNQDNGLVSSQPASIVLNPGPAGSIILPVAAIGVLILGTIYAYKSGYADGKRDK